MRCSSRTGSSRRGHAVADDLGLPRWWLNERASTYISGKDDADKRRVFDHPGLRVMAASPRHIFAMKALAAEHVTLMIFACSPASSEWNQPTLHRVSAVEIPPCRFRALIAVSVVWVAVRRSQRYAWQ